MLKLILCLTLLGPISTAEQEGLFVRSLWLLQQYGSEAAADAQHDRSLKSALTKALANDSEITFNEIREFMSSKSFEAIAGKDSSIDTDDISRALHSSLPGDRAKLNAKVRQHAEYLTTSFDMIDLQHQQAAQDLANWMVSECARNKPLDVIVICTGNSRRSILGSAMGNLAAAYYGLVNVRFYSGGTAPSAFNARSIRALEDIGFSVEATGKEAIRGEQKIPNPKYHVKWGEGMEATEFSKLYSDESNPQNGFAALMVCTDADAGCPNVTGAGLRLSMPYLDPKNYDGSSIESAKYAERRDDIGRMMLSAMCQVRRALDAKKRE